MFDIGRIDSVEVVRDTEFPYFQVVIYPSVVLVPYRFSRIFGSDLSEYILVAAVSVFVVCPDCEF